MEPSKARRRPTILITSAIILLVCFPTCYWVERAFQGNNPCPAMIFSRGNASQPLAFDFDNIEALYTGSVGEPALSPDGAWLAITADTSVEVYDLPTGELITILNTESRVRDMEWSGDGSLLAGVISTYAKPAEIAEPSPTWDKSIVVWDWKTARLLLSEHIPSNALDFLRPVDYIRSVDSLAFSPDSKQLIATAGSAYWVWDIASGSQQCKGEYPMEDVNTDDYDLAVGWQPDGPPLVAEFLTGQGIPLNRVMIWNLATGLPVLTIDPGTDLFVSALWSPGGNYIALQSSNYTYGRSLNRITVWDIHSGDLVLELGDRYMLRTWSPDGKYLAVWSREEVVVWDVPAGEQHLIPIGNADTIIGINWVAQYLLIQTLQGVEVYSIGIR